MEHDGKKGRTTPNDRRPPTWRHRGLGKVTHLDIARRLRLSESAVTKVLNESSGFEAFAEETRRRIITTAEELGYVRVEKRRKPRERSSVFLPVAFSIMLTETHGEFSNGVASIENASMRGGLLSIESMDPAAIPLRTFFIVIHFLFADGAPSTDGVMAKFCHAIPRASKLSAIGMEFTSFFGRGEQILARHVSAIPAPGTVQEDRSSVPHIDILPFLKKLPSPVEKVSRSQRHWLSAHLRPLALLLTKEGEKIVLAVRDLYIRECREQGYWKLEAERTFMEVVSKVVAKVKADSSITIAPDLPAPVDQPTAAESIWLSVYVRPLAPKLSLERKRILVAFRRQALKGCKGDKGKKRDALEKLKSMLPALVKKVCPK